MEISLLLLLPGDMVDKLILPVLPRGANWRQERSGAGHLCQPPPPVPPLQCNFALVQYGAVIQTEFDLRDSQDVNASLARVQNIIQVGNVTKTASAMQHVL